MLKMAPNEKSLIDRPKPRDAITLDSEDDDIQVGMDFENQIVVIEIDTTESGNTSILTLPISVAYHLALKVLEATTIINFANSIGLNLQEDGNE